MPFVKFINNTENSHTYDPDEVPVFVFPGVLGNGQTELHKFAEKLNALRQGKTPIYIYVEPELARPIEMTNEELAKHIAEEIKQIRQSSPLPYNLVGYSDGGIKAACTALELEKAGLQTHTFIIDQPAVQLVQDKFNKDLLSESTDTDTLRTQVAIVNYAAKLAGLEPIDFKKEKLDDIGRIGDLNERFDHLHTTLLVEQKSDRKLAEALIDNTNKIAESLDAESFKKLRQFLFYIETAKRNWNNIQAANTDILTKLENVHVLFTKETALKYGANENNWQDFTGGWDKSCNTVTNLTTDKQATTTHTSLLSGESAFEIAELISTTLRSKITREELINKNLEPIFGEILKTNPNIESAQLKVLLNQLITGNPNKPTARQDAKHAIFFRQFNAEEASTRKMVEEKQNVDATLHVLSESRASMNNTALTSKST